MIEIIADALDIAADLGSERNSEVVRGALHGVPILVKDVSARSPVVFYAQSCY